MPVTLVIKTPNQKLSDLVFSCEPTHSVLRLKEELQLRYPNHPNPDEQRLIYSGRLLVDGEFLKDFLRDLESEETHTIHLVYTSKNQTEVSSPPTMTDTESTSIDGLRQRFTSNSQPQPPSPPHWSPTPNAQFPVWANQAADPIAQQLLWWQQTYAQQYWAQYMQHMSNMASQPTASPTTPSPTSPSPVATPVAQAPEVNAAPEAQRRPLVVGMAQEDDDDGGAGGIRAARDWLDWIYVGSRLSILLAVMYYYSSLPRFILVTLIVAGIYLYQKAAQRRYLLAEVNNNVNVQQPAEHVADPPIGEQAEDHSPAAPAAAAAVPVTANPNALNVAFNLFVGFFTSLIPDVPAPEVLN